MNYYASAARVGRNASAAMRPTKYWVLSFKLWFFVVVNSSSTWSKNRSTEKMLFHLWSSARAQIEWQDNFCRRSAVHSKVKRQSPAQAFAAHSQRFWLTRSLTRPQTRCSLSSSHVHRSHSLALVCFSGRCAVLVLRPPPVRPDILTHCSGLTCSHTDIKRADEQLTSLVSPAQFASLVRIAFSNFDSYYARCWHLRGTRWWRRVRRRIADGHEGDDQREHANSCPDRVSTVFTAQKDARRVARHTTVVDVYSIGMNLCLATGPAAVGAGHTVDRNIYSRSSAHQRLRVRFPFQTFWRVRSTAIGWICNPWSLLSSKDWAWVKRELRTRFNYLLNSCACKLLASSHDQVRTRWFLTCRQIDLWAFTNIIRSSMFLLVSYLYCCVIVVRMLLCKCLLSPYLFLERLNLITNLPI